jgi:hypothetical protein
LLFPTILHTVVAFYCSLSVGTHYTLTKTSTKLPESPETTPTTETEPQPQQPHQPPTVPRSTSIRSLFASSMGASMLAEVRCDPLTAVCGDSVCRINNSKDHHFPPFSVEECVGRAISELGRQKYHLLFTNCEHFASWCRYGSKSSYQVRSRSQSLFIGVQIYTI